MIGYMTQLLFPLSQVNRIGNLFFFFFVQWHFLVSSNFDSKCWFSLKQMSKISSVQLILIVK